MSSGATLVYLVQIVLHFTYSPKTVGFASPHTYPKVAHVSSSNKSCVLYNSSSGNIVPYCKPHGKLHQLSQDVAFILSSRRLMKSSLPRLISSPAPKDAYSLCFLLVYSEQSSLLIIFTTIIRTHIPHRKLKLRSPTSPNHQHASSRKHRHKLQPNRTPPCSNHSRVPRTIRSFTIPLNNYHQPLTTSRGSTQILHRRRRPKSICSKRHLFRGPHPSETRLRRSAAGREKNEF